MSEEIINRVANSELITFDLEDYYPEGVRFPFDLKDWLYEGLVLREKEFRQHVKTYVWSQHKDHFIALFCSTEAIIPDWAFMLIALHLQPYAKKVVFGNLESLETALYQDVIGQLEISAFENKPVIIKGCSKKPVPTSAYVMITNKLKPVARSIMFGEACSSVPLFKKK